MCVRVWLQLVRVTGAICGCLAIAIGLYQLITSVFNPRTIINGVYQVIFGLLILVAEARWSGLLRHFKFLTHFFGLGMFYIFVGGTATQPAEPDSTQQGRGRWRK